MKSARINNAPPPAQEDSSLTHLVYGDTLGEAYIMSLLNFTKGVHPRLTELVRSKVDHLTCGSFSFLAEANQVRTVAKKEAEAGGDTKIESIIRSKWGEIDVLGHIDKILAEAGRLTEFVELNAWKKDIVDIAPLLMPVTQMSTQEITTEMVSSTTDQLFASTMKDVEMMIRLRKDRVLNNNPNISEDEKKLAEKLRLRLLHLVQRAPVQEFSAKSVPPHLRAMYQSYTAASALLPTGTPMKPQMMTMGTPNPLSMQPSPLQVQAAYSMLGMGQMGYPTGLMPSPFGMGAAPNMQNMQSMQNMQNMFYRPMAQTPQPPRK